MKKKGFLSERNIKLLLNDSQILNQIKSFVNLN